MLQRLSLLSLLLMLALVGGCRHHNEQTADLSTTGQTGAPPVIAILALDNTSLFAARALDTAFTQAAPRYGFAMRSAQTPRVALYLKGYFSILTDDSPADTAILYVFDILDPSGLRLHRIRGRYPLRHGVAPSPQHFWKFVPMDGYTMIADNILGQINKWRPRLRVKKAV